MKHTLFYTRSALKDIQALDTLAKKRVQKKIEEYATNPTLHAKKLISPRIGAYRWRAGDYRIVFDIVENKIFILRIGHRREIYK
jgi:mRNA interferase RelE/StbE